MKKLLMVLAMGLTLSSVGLASDRAQFFGGRGGEVVVAAAPAPAYAAVDWRREHRCEPRRHRHYWW
jgi:hypothetical protein